MSCCAPGADGFVGNALSLPSDDEVRFAARKLDDKLFQAEFSVPAVHCGGCIHNIEKGLSKIEGVEAARVNLSTRRVTVRWRGDDLPPIVATLAKLGYAPTIFDEPDGQKDRTLTELFIALAVSGLASSNIMLLSVSVWSGAEGATRDLFHWVSALIALPVMYYSGRIYYRSAWSALRHGRMNMDVPIAIGVTMAYLLSLYETIHSGEHAYFDAAVTLLFFLLIGRTLDHVMREKARTAVRGLARLAPRGALVVRPDGLRDYIGLAEVEPGMQILVAAGERIPVDALVAQGESDIDRSLVSGESAPQRIRQGDAIQAGTLNLTGPLTLTATARADDSFLAEMLRMMEAAEGGRANYRRIADRVSSAYAPVVHLGAFLTFLGWMFVTGGDWHYAATVAIAVLIITCPCALGLAVPIVQVVAARRLFEHGIMVRDGSAMERLAQADTALFDKTGTLTLGHPRLQNLQEIAPEALAAAAALGAHSRHPLSQSIALYDEGNGPEFTALAEVPGLGIEGSAEGSLWRLGRAQWASENGAGRVFASKGASASEIAGTVLTRDGNILARFEFDDTIRPEANQALVRVEERMGPVEMLSGDTQTACQRVADRLGIAHVASGLMPADKVARIETLSGQGRKVLMVGDGLNDAPALAAAHVSMAPATAADIGRNAADFVFLRDSLMAVPVAYDVSRRAGELVRQNVTIAIIYNFIAVPIAVLGYVTPLIAAIAMSASSIVVITNALRLGRNMQ